MPCCSIAERLDRGAFVGMLGDRTLGDEPVQAVTLLGERADLPTGPMRAAAILRRPVIFMVGLYRGRNRYHVVFAPIADFSTTPAGARDAAVRTAVERYAALLDRYCRSDPYNWFNFFDFWRERADKPVHETPARSSRLIGLLALSASPRAAPADDLDELMHLLAARQHGQVSFVEQHFLALLKRPAESSGELIYDAPDRLEKRTFEPRPESMSLRGDVLTIRRGSAQPRARPEVLSPSPAVHREHPRNPGRRPGRPRTAYSGSITPAILRAGPCC